MIPAIKSEFRKLFTVRSTFVIFALSLLLAVFFAFYVDGIKGGPTVNDPGKLASEVTNAINTVSILCAIVGVLLITHEYRYNTIMYTLTASRSRTQVFIAKIIAISVFAVVFSLIFAVISPFLAYLGVQVKGLHMVHQVLPVWSLLWRAIFVGWGMSMLALILAFIIRIQVGAIAALFIIPSTVESVFGLLLKNNVVYLPFSALNSVLQHHEGHIVLTYGRAALVALIYIVIGWLIAWQLFLRRDAN